MSLKDHWVQILLVLADGDSHGLAIADQVLEQSDGRTRLWPATLYGSLEQMTEQGFIRELVAPDERPANANDRQRIYRITDAGRAALREEQERLRQLVQLMEHRLSPHPGK